MGMHRLKKFKERMNARLLKAVDTRMDRLYGARKRSVWETLPRTVVEVGAGAGANMRYYTRGTHLIAIEPNPAMHPLLRAAAAGHDIDLQIRGTAGEAIDLPSDSVEGVVGTLVLCTVDDPGQVVSEVLRVLKPGGRYIFLEHVAAIHGTRLRGLQQILRRPWRWLFDGCHLNRDTHATLLRAGFSRLDMDCFVAPSGWLPFAPHIFGLAVK